MNDVTALREIHLPDRLRHQISAFRRQVWTLKLFEALCIGGVAVGAAVALMFACDRIGDTPTSLRIGIASLALAGLAVIPWSIHHWVWRRRGLEQIARLIARRSSAWGDRLLGVMELVDNSNEQARSPELCRAAIRQVAEDAETWDLSRSLPPARLALWRRLAAATGAGLVILAVLVPAATWNAISRCALPWKPIPRYTFAVHEPLPERLVIPHGEPHRLTVALASDSKWSPTSAELRIGGRSPIKAIQKDGHYEFLVPPQIAETRSRLIVGDAYQDVTIAPTFRPELVSVTATVRLPAYLQLTEPRIRDVRSGGISLVDGSETTFVARANRELESASIDGRERRPVVDTITSEPTVFAESRGMSFRWRDRFGLSEKAPFSLGVEHVPDEAPSLVCEGLGRQSVVLDIEQLQFKIRANDDFGVREVGMEWRGIAADGLPNATHGEQVLAGGGPEQEQLEATGTFTARSLKIDPQAIQLRVYATDFLPDRQRVYSPPYLLIVMDVDQHAIWMTEQLNRWHRQALEVRDRELALYETNKELRAMSAEQLESTEARAMLERQASAEAANGRRLEGLARAGEDLVRQAARNPEFGVGHLEKWAEMLQILQDISLHRMPSVAELLQKASAAPQLASNPTSSRTVGQDLGAATRPDGSPKSDDNSKPRSPVPSLVDRESSQQPPDSSLEEVASSESPPSTASLRLPTTTLAGKARPNEACPVADTLDKAIDEQRDLLAEFEKIADELNQLLANLEGSTLVKRLKAASRAQYRVATDLGELIDKSFGRLLTQLENEDRHSLEGLTKAEVQGSETVSAIMDDLQAYFERRPLTKFRTVLEEMKEQDVVGGLRQVGSDLPLEQGLSMAQCEYWSDNLDRWAEDLVDPTSGGT